MKLSPLAQGLIGTGLLVSGAVVGRYTMLTAATATKAAVIAAVAVTILLVIGGIYCIVRACLNWKASRAENPNNNLPETDEVYQPPSKPVVLPDGSLHQVAIPTPQNTPAKPTPPQRRDSWENVVVIPKSSTPPANPAAITVRPAVLSSVTEAKPASATTSVAAQALAIAPPTLTPPPAAPGAQPAPAPSLTAVATSPTTPILPASVEGSPNTASSQPALSTATAAAASATEPAQPEELAASGFSWISTGSAQGFSDFGFPPSVSFPETRQDKPHLPPKPTTTPQAPVATETPPPKNHPFNLQPFLTLPRNTAPGLTAAAQTAPVTPTAPGKHLNMETPPPPAGSSTKTTK